MTGQCVLIASSLGVLLGILICYRGSKQRPEVTICLRQQDGEEKCGEEDVQVQIHAWLGYFIHVSYKDEYDDFYDIALDINIIISNESTPIII